MLLMASLRASLGLVLASFQGWDNKIHVRIKSGEPPFPSADNINLKVPWSPVCFWFLSKNHLDNRRPGFDKKKCVVINIPEEFLPLLNYPIS